MKAKELRERLEGVEDEAEVLVRLSDSEGFWYEEAATVKELQLTELDRGDFYHPENIAFPPIDRVNVVIIQ